MKKKKEEDDGLEEMIKSKMENTIKDYFDTVKYNGMMTKIISDFKIDPNKNNTQLILQRLEKFKKNNEGIENPKKLIEDFNFYLEELYNLQNTNNSNNNNKNNGTISKLKIKYNEINNYFDKTSAIRFLLVGPHNSGKSSILNNIIGYNQKFLPTDLKETTKTGIIIKYVKKGETPKLFDSKFITNKSGYNYFEYNKDEPIAEGETNIYSTICGLNNEYSNNSNLEFFLLESPIEFLDKMNITEEEKKKIELIDYPGLDTEFELAKVKAKDLLKIVDGFIYVLFEISFDKANKDVFILMYNTIKERINFSFNTCLFILNKIDSFNEGINYEKIQEQILKIFDKTNKFMKSTEVLELKQKIGDENISLSGFSSQRYDEYKKLEENILNFENFIEINNTKKEEYFSFFKSEEDIIIKNLKENYLEKINIKNFNPNQNEFNIRLNDLKNIFKNKKKVDIEKLKKIVNLYLYILENRTNLKVYKLSKISDLLRNFKQVLENTFKFYEIKKQNEALDFISYCINQIFELFNIIKIKVKNPNISEFEGINTEDIIAKIKNEKERLKEYVDEGFKNKKHLIFINIDNCNSENSFENKVYENNRYCDELSNDIFNKCEKYYKFLKDEYQKYIKKLHLEELEKSKKEFEEKINKFKTTKFKNSSRWASDFVSIDTIQKRFLFIKWEKKKYNHKKTISKYKDSIDDNFTNGKIDIFNKINQNTKNIINNIENIFKKFNEEVGGFKDNLNEFQKIIEKILNFIYMKLGVKGEN